MIYRVSVVVQCEVDVPNEKFVDTVLADRLKRITWVDGWNTQSVMEKKK